MWLSRGRGGLALARRRSVSVHRILLGWLRGQSAEHRVAGRRQQARVDP
jgi:hypothetical protein